jgi:hypothetical protein
MSPASPTTAPTPTPTTAAPVAVIAYAGKDQPVTFTMATLLRLEATCGCGIYAIIDRFRSIRPERRVLNGEVLSDEQIADLPEEDRDSLEATPEAKRAALAKFKLSHVAEFCAGCLGDTVDGFTDRVAPGRIMEIFADLQPPFWEAINQLQGAEDEADPTTPSAPERGSGSSSACEPVNSDGSHLNELAS